VTRYAPGIPPTRSPNHPNSGAVASRPYARVSVAPLTRDRLHALQLVDSGANALPNPFAVNIALGEQFVGALRCNDRSVSAMPLHQQMSRAPDVDFFCHRTCRGGCRATVGNGAKPICDPIQLGCCSVAPLHPQAEQRAARRSMSLDASTPQRMMSGASATGRWWPQPAAQFNQSHGAERRRSARVGTGGRSDAIPIAWRVAGESQGQRTRPSVRAETQASIAWVE
jgi:hypothetical protein